jgi:hypothetical protein
MNGSSSFHQFVPGVVTRSLIASKHLRVAITRDESLLQEALSDDLGLVRLTVHVERGHVADGSSEAGQTPKGE